MLRSILAVLLGVIVGGIVIAVVEMIGHKVYPPPADLDASNPEALKAYFAMAPFGAFLFVLAAWASGAFVGGSLAAWIARRAPAVHALIVASVVLYFAVDIMLKIPHPPWLWLAGPLSILLVAYLGALLVARPVAVSGAKG